MSQVSNLTAANLQSLTSYIHNKIASSYINIGKSFLCIKEDPQKQIDIITCGNIIATQKSPQNFAGLELVNHHLFSGYAHRVPVSLIRKTRIYSFKKCCSFYAFQGCGQIFHCLHRLTVYRGNNKTFLYS